MNHSVYQKRASLAFTELESMTDYSVLVKGH